MWRPVDLNCHFLDSCIHVYIPILIFMMMIKDIGQAIIINIIVLASTVLLFPRRFVFVELVCFPSVVCVFLPPLPFIIYDHSSYGI